MSKAHLGKRRAINGALTKGKSVERIGFGLNSNLPDSPGIKIKKPEKSKVDYQEVPNVAVNNFSKKAKDMQALVGSQE